MPLMLKAWQVIKYVSINGLNSRLLEIEEVELDLRVPLRSAYHTAGILLYVLRIAFQNPRPCSGHCSMVIIIVSNT